jgi:hypothetical protein
MDENVNVKAKTNKIIRTGRKVKLNQHIPDVHHVPDVPHVPHVSEIYQPFNIIDDQNRAYYESLEKDMEKEFQEQLAQIQRLELESLEEIKRNELLRIEELAKIEKEKNQPSQEEMRQRRLKFYENK